MTDNSNYLMALKKPEVKKGRVPNKCWVTECPLMATIENRGTHTCPHHYARGYGTLVTRAILNNMYLIKGYGNMVRWNSVDWVKHHNYLVNHQQIPMLENELRTMYLKRFYEFTADKIADEASEMVTH